LPIRRLAFPIALLVALLLALAATARAAGPTPDPAPPQYPKVSLQTDVPIVMSDGVRLVGDILRPADASGAPVAQPLPGPRGARRRSVCACVRVATPCG
jgi:predicted acyl esterase